MTEGTEGTDVAGLAAVALNPPELIGADGGGLATRAAGAGAGATVAEGLLPLVNPPDEDGALGLEGAENPPDDELLLLGLPAHAEPTIINAKIAVNTFCIPLSLMSQVPLLSWVRQETLALLCVFRLTALYTSDKRFYWR